jgi:hypothetical protein
MQQVTVGRVNFNDTEMGLPSADGGKAEVLDYFLNAGNIEFARPAIAGGKRQGAGRGHAAPAAFFNWRDRLGLPGFPHARFSAGVRELNAHRAVLGSGKIHDPAQVGNMLVFPEAHIARRDSAFGRHRRGFDEDEARAADRAASQVNQMPVGGEAVLTRVLPRLI